MTSSDKTLASARPRLLIEDWLPIAEIGIESVRERTPMTPFPAPNRLHVWWARRPLVASRAAILASLLPADADPEKFLRVLGIHGDPMASKERIAEARRTGERFEGNAYSYKRAFTYTPSSEEAAWLSAEHAKLGHIGAPTVLDPTAGGGSIPFEASRLGLHAIANDLNPVAWLILRSTIEFPARFGTALLKRYRNIACEFVKRRDEQLRSFFPPEPLPNSEATNWIWARTVNCPYCGGLVPLSPNWRLDSSGTGVQLIPRTNDPTQRRCKFEIVYTVKEQSAGTVKGGNGLCPYPDCGRVFDGDEIKSQAQAGKMGDQLYAVVFKQSVETGITKSGKVKFKTVRGFRAPRPEDEVSEQVTAALTAKMPEWEARNIIPDEERYIGPADRSGIYGLNRHQQLFSPRQLLGHGTSVEVFHDLVDELRQKHDGTIPEFEKAALTYIAIAIDKLLNYNSRMSVWMPTRQVVANTFNRHDFAFCWSYAEMAPTTVGQGYDWTIEQTGKALEELIELTGGSNTQSKLFDHHTSGTSITISHGSGDSLAIEDASIDCVVMDPPYYDNVMYAELADYFYVWLKRTVGLFYLEPFASHLTDKDLEAVANPAKFKGEKGGARNLAGRDYQQRMADIFRECRRVLRPDGVMTVMFTHKASGAWDEGFPR